MIRSRSFDDGGYASDLEVFQFGNDAIEAVVGRCIGTFELACARAQESVFFSGSPADRADLEVGDEILEVNGKSLESLSHKEVISHIHQCIRSRTICLRVKRKTGAKLGELYMKE